MAENMDCSTEWRDWKEIPPVRRIGVEDYYVPGIANVSLVRFDP